MDDELIRNDRTYISTSLAAELTGYSQDYVGQLARDGHIESVKVGHKRFVGRDDLVAYAVDNKNSLSLSDIPDNHRPESLQSTDEGVDPEEAENEESAEASTEDVQQTHGSDDNTEDIDQTSEIRMDSSDEIPENGQAYTIRSGPQKQRERSDLSETLDVPDRANARWQKASEGLRSHAEPKTPTKQSRKVPKLLAALLAMVISFSFLVGSVPNTKQMVGRVAVNISQASEQAYYALGVGLDRQLKEHGTVGIVQHSVEETAAMLTAHIQQAVTSDYESESQQPSAQSNQVAAAGSTIESFTDHLTQLIPDTNWLTKPAVDSDVSFRDYQNQPLITRSSVDISQAETMQRDEQGSSSKQAGRVDQPKKGAVVVSAPTSTEAREQKRKQIRQQFSDPVEITASTTNSGVVQPQFGEQAGDQYMYVMVPAKESNSTTTSAQE